MIDSEFEKDLEAIKDMPESEVKFVRMDKLEYTVMDIKLYRKSMAEDGGRNWEKLKKIRAMFRK